MARSAGIREARQNLSGLLAQVRKGHEIVITDRGRPVARLLPPVGESAKGVSSHRRFRAGIKLRGAKLSATIEADRADRL
ncbi:MAG: type II toxin-antitoxin system prevent-host-death family antitoxin [Deltaproteobacteria bacterium]|nr:type II toxin-antitoxin system prevent-host-death family antitoxin [Deltaproteobacteria bacterium]